MKLKTGLVMLLGLFPLLGNASALVFRDDKTATLNFITQINFQGSALTPQNAYASAVEISRLWNESRASVRYLGKVYRTRFVISYTVNDAWRIMRDTSSCAENYVQIEPMRQSGDRSFYELFGRNGTFYTSDDLGHSTTVAHEYGHGLGLEHDDYNQLAAPVPGIMFARGTLVKPQFQWNPSVQPGAPGGSVNPKYRKVRAADIAKLDLGTLKFVGNYACLGAGVPARVQLMNVVPSRSVAPRLRPSLENNSSPDVESERNLEAHDH
jgi:hypothetical protein